MITVPTSPTQPVSTNMSKYRKPGLSLRTMSLQNERSAEIERQSVRRVHDEEERAHSESGSEGILEVGCECFADVRVVYGC